MLWKVIFLHKNEKKEEKSNEIYDVAAFLPFWNDISADHQEDIVQHMVQRIFPKGSVLRPYDASAQACLGFVLVKEGQLRAFMLSESGKEVTLYRLFALDVCLFSASCVMRNIQFDIQVEAEKDTSAWVIPAPLCNRLMQQSLAMADFTNQLMASRFSDVMWTLDQILFKSMDSRIAALLLELAIIEGQNELSVTHEELAKHLGTAREVVTRLLKYFQSDGILVLSRGSIRLLNTKRLQALAE